jgi:hypothetical protein
MIYSFLDKELSEKLNVIADATFPKEYGNKFVFSLLDENDLVISEEEDNYGDKSIVNADRIQLKPGDQIIARSIDGLTVIRLFKMGVKVSLLQFEVVALPIDKQTPDKKAELVYSLVSLD